MKAIESCELPDNALLREYVRENTYTDCFRTDLSRTVSQAEYIEAFYTTWLFKLERQILRWLISKASSDADARQLATGQADSFAAWNVEARSENQILLCDFRGRTRSWLMTEPSRDNESDRTSLYFGSAVVPVRNSKTGEMTLGSGFSVLLGLHKVYSRALLRAAKSRLQV